MTASYIENTATISTTQVSLTTNTTYSTSNAQTTAGSVQLWLDVNALALGDVFEVALYEKTKSGGTQRVAQSWIIAGPQALPIWVSPAFLVRNGWDFTLIKKSGTDRSIDWSIRNVNV